MPAAVDASAARRLDRSAGLTIEFVIVFTANGRSPRWLSWAIGQISVAGLKQAAQNIAAVLPNVLPIAMQIADAVRKIVGG